METTFLIRKPAEVSRCGLLEAWTKFTVALDEVMESVSEIGGIDQIRIYAIRNDSSHLYIDGFGFPLSFRCQTKGRLGKVVEGRLYINKKTSETRAFIDDVSREEFCDSIESVVKSLSTAILSRFTSSSD